MEEWLGGVRRALGDCGIWGACGVAVSSEGDFCGRSLALNGSTRNR